MLVRRGDTAHDHGDRADGPSTTRLEEERRAMADRHLRRTRRVRNRAAAWATGAALLTTLWVVGQWRGQGPPESLGHEGEQGQWNPTLWALGVGVWGLAVGIMALRVRFERPPTTAGLESEANRIAREPGAATRSPAEARALAYRRLVDAGRVRFHVASWVLGMAVGTPLWALIEWQDNGDLERFSSDDQPGSWEPWILYAGGIWAGIVALLAIRLRLDRRRREGRS